MTTTPPDAHPSPVRATRPDRASAGDGPLMARGLRQQLLDGGWEERFSAAGGRLEEMAAYYRALGYEVRVERVVDLADGASCISCFGGPGAESPAGVLFTRGAPTATPGDDELF